MDDPSSDIVCHLKKGAAFDISVNERARKSKAVVGNLNLASRSLRTSHQAFPIHTVSKFTPKGASRVDRDMR